MSLVGLGASTPLCSPSGRHGGVACAAQPRPCLAWPRPLAAPGSQRRARIAAYVSAGNSDIKLTTPVPPAGPPNAREAAPPQPQGTILLPKLPLPPAVPSEVLGEFEHKLEADVQTVAVTLAAIMGVIVFWRGVWSLLDHFIGDSVFGDFCCVIVGLSIVFWIRLSGFKIASFWPNS